MARLVQATCPGCGAVVPLEGDSDRAKCQYCGAMAIVASAAPPAPGTIPPVPRSSGMMVGCAVVGVVAVLGAGLGAMLLLSGGEEGSVPEPARAPVAVPVPASPMPSPPPAVAAADPVSPVGALGGAPLLGLDVDGDHRLEIVAPVDDGGTERYAVFDPRTGARRAATPPLQDLSNSIVAGIGNRLVVATASGRLDAYDLVSGDAQWSTTLGDRVLALCAPAEPGAVHVETSDERRLSVDLTTGRQSETRATCAHLLARGPRPEPRDRRDHSAPRGVDAWVCGTVRVMGSDNYVVPDACAARGHVDSDGLDGMVGHRIWKSGSGWLVFGVRRPGTYVPMVGRLERGRFVWKSEVPADNPLEAETGGPRPIALVGETLVVGYSAGRSPRVGTLTAFAIGDGARRWTVPLGEEPLADLVALDDAVVVRTGATLRVLAAADGAVRTTIGR